MTKNIIISILIIISLVLGYGIYVNSRETDLTTGNTTKQEDIYTYTNKSYGLSVELPKRITANPKTDPSYLELIDSTSGDSPLRFELKKAAIKNLKWDPFNKNISTLRRSGDSPNSPVIIKKVDWANGSPETLYEYVFVLDPFIPNSILTNEDQTALVLTKLMINDDLKNYPEIIRPELVLTENELDTIAKSVKLLK